jgi:hypothetical protein
MLLYEGVGETAEKEKMKFYPLIDTYGIAQFRRFNANRNKRRY